MAWISFSLMMPGLPFQYTKLITPSVMRTAEYMGILFEASLDDTKSPEYIDKAVDRIAYELNQVETRGMSEFMRTVIFIIDQLKAKNVLWGVGRGSSCASYLLFLIGLHVVDCVALDVNPDEFFHD